MSYFCRGLGNFSTLIKRPSLQIITSLTHMSAQYTRTINEKQHFDQIFTIWTSSEVLEIFHRL